MGPGGVNTINMVGAHAAYKLTDRQVREIRDRAAWDSMTQRALAEEFGVHESQVSRIINGKSRTRKTVGVKP